EVDLCGHATLASAYVLFHILKHREKTIVFQSRSGELRVTNTPEGLTMDFPAQPPRPCLPPENLRKAFSKSPLEWLKSEDYLVVFPDEQDVRDANPTLSLLSTLELRGVIITAPSSQYDFVCRFFAPKYGIPEDPVTGSAFTQLAPYWASRTGRKHFRARQLSARGGEVICEIGQDRVFITGQAVKYLEGTIFLNF
ncbi:MAG: PhzF family phenazine biosynthesis protein, partial [Calditrichaeota bacterium]